jgi:hypothetical protein
MPDCPGEPVVTSAYVLFSFAREAMGASAHPAFPAPSLFSRVDPANPDAIAPRECGIVPSRCLTIKSGSAPLPAAAFAGCSFLVSRTRCGVLAPRRRAGTYARRPRISSAPRRRRAAQHPGNALPSAHDDAEAVAFRHCEERKPTSRREAPPDGKLHEAVQGSTRDSGSLRALRSR